MMPSGPAGGMQPPGPGFQQQQQQQLQHHQLSQLQSQLMKSSVMGPDGKASQGYNMAAVRERTIQLRQSIVDVVNALHTNPHLLHWDAVLKKYSTVNLQVQALRENLRANLRNVAVHPKFVNSPQLSQVLPIQLASALTPEHTEAEKALVDQEQAIMMAAGFADETDWYEATDRQREAYQSLIAELTGDRGPLSTDPKEPNSNRKRITDQSAKIAKSLAALRQNTSQSQQQQQQQGGSGPGTGTGAAAVGAKRKADGSAPGTTTLDPVLKQLLTGEVAGRAAGPQHHQPQAQR